MMRLFQILAARARLIVLLALLGGAVVDFTASGAAAVATAWAEEGEDYYDFVDEMKLTPQQRALYLRTLRGAVFGMLAILVGFGALYVMSHTGLAGNFGPRFFRARGETILLRLIAGIFLSAIVFGLVGAAGVDFGFINYLVGEKPPTPEDEAFF